eukprot:4329726-Pyramimonas_sp.AAC.1
MHWGRSSYAVPAGRTLSPEPQETRRGGHASLRLQRGAMLLGQLSVHQARGGAGQRGRVWVAVTGALHAAAAVGVA